LKRYKTHLRYSGCQQRTPVNLHKKESLIFPAIDDPSDLNDNSDFDVVNKILALVADPPKICKAIKEGLEDRLSEIRSEAFQQITGSFSEDIAIEQVKDLTEFYWAAAKLEDPGDPEQYKTARDNAEALLAARKSTRNFKQVLPVRADVAASAMAWGGYVPKSSLDGQRESVIHESVYDAVRNGQKTKKELRLEYGVREGERLCGVGLLKRHGNRKTSGNPRNNGSFFSTSHVAATPLLQRLKDAGAVENYLTTLKSQTVDFRGPKCPAKSATEVK
jgi:hypothetical protein